MSNAEPEYGPVRNNLTDLNISEIINKSDTRDIAQAMADELSLEALRDEATATTERIKDLEASITSLQDELRYRKWKQVELQQSIQIAQEKPLD